MKKRGNEGSACLFLVKRILSEDPFADRFAFHQVFLHEARNAVSGHALIPRSLRIDEHRRPVAADSQTTDLGAVTGRAQWRLLDLLLEDFPRGHARFRRAAG